MGADDREQHRDSEDNQCDWVSFHRLFRSHISLRL
jgi:hypothetical protein